MIKRNIIKLLIVISFNVFPSSSFDFKGCGVWSLDNPKKATILFYGGVVGSHAIYNYFFEKNKGKFIDLSNRIRECYPFKLYTDAEYKSMAGCIALMSFGCILTNIFTEYGPKKFTFLENNKKLINIFKNISVVYIVPYIFFGMFLEGKHPVGDTKQISTK